MKPGDLVLVIGPNFFEKTRIKDRKKGVYYLDNGILMDRNLTPLNSKYTIEEFNEEKYNTLMAKLTLTRGLEKLGNMNRMGISDPKKLIYAANKISRILEKLN